LFTTPLLLTGLALTAMHGLRKRWGVILGLIASDVLMIVTSLFFGLTTDVWTRWMWFVISCGAFLAVYYGIWVQLKTINKAAAADVQKAFMSSAVFLSVIWFIYPVILAVGTDGVGIVSLATTAAVIAVLDLVAKVAYGLASTAAITKITAADISEARPEADLQA
jgi:bacteriorhodopsin